MQSDLLHEAHLAALNKYNASEWEERAIIEVVNAALLVVVADLHKTVYPEKHPRFDHVYWHGIEGDEPEDAYQWDADTIEWIATSLDQLWRKLGKVTK